MRRGRRGSVGLACRSPGVGGITRACPRLARTPTGRAERQTLSTRGGGRGVGGGPGRGKRRLICMRHDFPAF